MEKNNLIITLKVRRIFFCLILIIVLLVLLNLIGGMLVRNPIFLHKFHLDHEQNIPTYFSSLILLFSAGLLGIIAALERKKKKANSSYWAWLAFIFLFFSLDETAVLHEEMIIPLREALCATGIFYFTWVIPGIIFILFFGILFLRFFLQLPRETKFLFKISAILYIGGALGCDLFGGWFSFSFGEKNLIYFVITTIEETLEMTGVAVFIYALLRYLCVNFKEVTFLIRDTE
ncbi:MAG: hypothetical protein PHY73_00300 [Candidatus Omnitrophica bacterium]|nr:hypothetical protein [Candidatus Omnitrophota bacterium]